MIKSILYEFHPRYAARFTKVIMAIVILGAFSGVAYAGNGMFAGTGIPKTKGELKSYIADEVIAPNDELMAHETERHRWYVGKGNQDIKILNGVIKLVTDCRVCVVMKDPPGPSPTDLEELEKITLPSIGGNPDDPISDEDNQMFAGLKEKLDENHRRHARNETKRGEYLFKLEGLILYYTDPEIKCAEPEICLVCEIITVGQPGHPGPTPTPTTIPDIPCEAKMCGADESAPDAGDPANAATADPSPIAPTHGASAGTATEGWATGNGDGSVGTSGGSGIVVVAEPLAAP